MAKYLLAYDGDNQVFETFGELKNWCLDESNDAGVTIYSFMEGYDIYELGEPLKIEVKVETTFRIKGK